MQVGMIGLGRMGLNLALNMQSHRHMVVGYNRSPEKVQQAKAQGIAGVASLRELAEHLVTPRIIWLMVPAGPAVDQVLEELVPLLARDDIVIDGGNSHYRDTIRRARALRDKGIWFVDAGTSGGIEGARYGVCAMIGCEEEIFARLEPLFRDISVENGYYRTGVNGTGHFTKMVHNGIEYGMLQAMGEGFEILHQSEFDFDLKGVARVWSHGSVIRGWLMELAEEAFGQDPQLASIRGVVHSSGEGMWTAQTALELGVPAMVITDSVYLRYRSEQGDSFAGKVVAALRKEFGGHEVEQLREDPTHV